MRSCLISCLTIIKSREDADAIVAAMRSGGDQDPEALKAKHAVQSLHAGKSAEQPRPLSDGDMSRDQIIDAFRAGEIKVLITTNVLARGIDVLQVSLVINFDMPFVYRHNQREGLDIETYLHRIGAQFSLGNTLRNIDFIQQAELVALERRGEMIVECLLAFQVDFQNRKAINFVHDSGKSYDSALFHWM